MQKKVEIILNKITTIFFDVDGVFTDGGLYFSENEVIMTKFNVHDGMGCMLLKETGVLLDLSLMKDGKSGFATTVTSVTQSTTVWRFGDDNEVL